MAGSSVDDLAHQLTGAHVNSDECTAIDYSGKALKLDKESDAESLIKDINGCSRMQVLRLNGNTIGPGAAQAIAGALEKHPELEQAQWSDMFTGRSRAEIPPALRALGGALIKAGVMLMELDLSDNAFGPVGVESIESLLHSRSCYTLKYLRLNNNGLGITGGKLLAKALLRCHASSVAAGTPLALKVFVSGRNRLENEGASALAEAIKAIGTLEEVSMPQNGINHAGIAALADAFASCRNLRSINLSDNTFTLKGALAMADALPKLLNLELINFESCLVKTEGARKIAAALAGRHSQLKEVNLQYNEIRVEGALALVSSLKDKAATLQRLFLNGNSLGEEGIESLRAAVTEAELLDRLGSLSEDEGSDEDDDESRASGPESDAEVAKDDEGGEVESSTDANGQKIQAVSPQELLSSKTPAAVLPSAVNALQWKQHMATELGVHTNSSDDVDVMQALLHKAMTYVMKLAAALGSVSTDEKEKAAAFGLCDAVFEVLPENAVVPSLLANTLMIHLGLIKSEDKKFVPVTDNLTGPLLLISHIVRQPYFPKAARDIVKICVGQPNKKMDPYVSMKHHLMQALYKA